MDRTGKIKFKLDQVHLKGKYNGYYYAKVARKGSTTTDTMAQIIQDRCTLTKTDVKAVLDALSEVMHEELSQGKRVCLEGIGYFSLEIDGPCKENPADISARTIRSVNVKFRPEMRKMATVFNEDTDGNSVARRVISKPLTDGIKFMPDSSVKDVIEKYKKRKG